MGYEYTNNRTIMNNELKVYVRKLLCPILGYCSALGYMKNFGRDNQPASSAGF
jgi:hypothetical protein